MHRKAQWPPFRQIASVSVTLRVLAVVVLLIFAIAAWFELRASRNAVVAETQRQMARLDMLFAEQTSRTIEAVDLLVMGAQDTVQAQKGHLDGVDEQLRQRIRGVRQLTAIIIVDPSGQPIVSTEQDRTSTPQAAIERLLEQYRSDPHAGLLIGPPFRVADNRWNVLLARPVVSPDGRLIQVAAGSVSLNVLEDFYRAVELNEDGAISLYLRDGTILARFPHLDTLIGTSFGNAPPFTDVLANAPSGTFLMPSPLDGTMRVGAIRALRTYPLAVVVSVSNPGRLAASGIRTHPGDLPARLRRRRAPAVACATVTPDRAFAGTNARCARSGRARQGQAAATDIGTGTCRGRDASGTAR